MKDRVCAIIEPSAEGAERKQSERKTIRLGEYQKRSNYRSCLEENKTKYHAPGSTGSGQVIHTKAAIMTKLKERTPRTFSGIPFGHFTPENMDADMATGNDISGRIDPEPT